MVIVTGQPRSGTSLMMQTLFHLQYPVFGIPHPLGRDKTWQPYEKPFWEHPDTLAGEIDMLRASEVAVKVNLRKAIERVTLQAGDKIILCERNHPDLAQAQTDLKIGSSTKERNEKQCSTWYGKFDKWATGYQVLKIDIDYFRANQSKVVDAIKTFIEVTTYIEKAVLNVSVLEAAK